MVDSALFDLMLPRVVTTANSFLSGEKSILGFPTEGLSKENRAI
jgi:hypothetical protein